MLHPNEKRILAIDLRSRSFGFVVLEGPTRLLDWGVKSFRQGVNAPTIPASEKLAALMEDSSPSTIVLRKRDSETKKRAEMHNAIVREATKRRIPIRSLSRNGVKNAFPDCNRNKYTVAIVLAKQLPELAPKLPPKRKIWKSEDYRMSMFDAAALGVAYFSRCKPSHGLSH